MKCLSRAVFCALMLASLVAPASAQVGPGISFGDPDTAFQPCDYYDTYDQAPPWGMPEDYCDYPVYSEPVYFGGTWYRGPIYYRWTHGRRLFWLNGGWREDGWRGPRPGRITWSHRGGHFRGGPGNGWRGRDWRGNWGHDRGRWGSDRSGWGQDRSGWGSDHGGDRGSRGSDHGGDGNHGGGGGHHH